jgi:hypothetical protein
VDQALTHIEAYIADEGINGADVRAMIQVLDTDVGDPGTVATAEGKSQMLWQR